MTDLTTRRIGLDPSVLAGGNPTDIVAFAPGRVNLIGEHTDYTGGLALPMAIQLGTTVHARLGGSTIRLRSDALDGEVALNLDEACDPSGVSPPWGRYVAGVAAELTAAAPTLAILRPIDGQITSSLPVGAGLSSSASLEIAVALALGFVGTTGELAHLAQRAEQAASGVPCGLMDQLAVACGVDGAALLVDFTSLEVTPVPVPPTLAVIVAHSGQQRTLAGSAYAQRRQDCERAADHVGGLATASLNDLGSIKDPVVRRRARHVLSENARVLAMVEALAADDRAGAGELLNESHTSLREDFEVSTPALDDLVAHLQSQPGVHGARLTGAGFGGCAVALAEPGAVADLLDDAGDRWLVVPSAGATIGLTS
jgi:galactokinase